MGDRKVYTNGYWSSGDASVFHGMKNPQDRCITPYLLEIIEKHNVDRMLDFGCGNAYLDTLVQAGEKYLYDLNPANISPAALARGCQVVSDLKVIPEGSLDCVVLSMVLVTLKSEKEYRHVLGATVPLLRPGGILLVADPHPCFNWQKFRYKNSDVEERGLSYFEEGAPFTALLQGLDGEVVKFTDYHHSLAFTLNMLSAAGLRLHELRELSDRSYDDMPANPKFPPFYLMVCKNDAPGATPAP